MVTKKAKKIVKTESLGKVVAKKEVVSKFVKAKPTPAKINGTSVTKKAVVTNEVPKEKNNTYIVIDHPCESEIVSGNNYVIRIGASFDGYVEISFNDGEWQPCRFASGYWWFDWMYYKTGNCKISARLVANDGVVIKISNIRKCKVV